MGTGIMYSTYTKPKYKHVDIYYNSLRINHVNVNNMDNIQGTSDSANVQKLKPLRQQRAPNFSTAQKSYLLELILDKQDIIESDNKNYMCVLKRTEAWKKIASTFSARYPDASRSEQQVKDFWRRQKVAAQKKRTAVNKSINKTGGGPMEADLSKESEAILGAIGEASNPMQNSFDDDAESDDCDSDRTMSLDDGSGNSDHESNSGILRVVYYSS